MMALSGLSRAVHSCAPVVRDWASILRRPHGPICQCGTVGLLPCLRHLRRRQVTYVRWKPLFAPQVSTQAARVITSVCLMTLAHPRPKVAAPNPCLRFSKSRRIFGGFCHRATICVNESSSPFLFNQLWIDINIYWVVRLEDNRIASLCCVASLGFDEVFGRSCQRTHRQKSFWYL